MAEPEANLLPPGHPLDTFRRENEAAGLAVLQAREAIAQLRQRPEGAAAQAAVARWRQAHHDLTQLEKHYQRKENLWFSRLERHGVGGPLKAIYAADEEIRQLLRRISRILAQAPAVEALVELAETTADPVLAEIEQMIGEEERVLFPLALEKLSDDDWGAIWRDSPQYGWCLVEPREGYQPPPAAAPQASLSAPQSVTLPTGALTVEQLQAIFSVLPVDLTFVDADDRVCYFSPGPERLFVRTPAVLGRKVQQCHPPGSIHVVEKILDDFRSGAQNVAEFWVNFRGKLVHIRYFAVRDPAGQYLGTLEVTQDLTPLRALQGERRLLQYDASPRATGGVF
jgi:hypothetical protein